MPELSIRPSRADEGATILAIVNAAAEAYRGVIPPDRWHDPYMDAEELRREIDSGVAFSACAIEGDVVGVMGIQRVRNVDLVRHAYVLPSSQGRGIGAALMRHSLAGCSRQVLVGTWAAATWAIRFYERNGFALVGDDAKRLLLRAYWTIPERQIETSVVLAAPALSLDDSRRLAS
jgi:GNAT superfamily N-acetyltransferase